MARILAIALAALAAGDLIACAAEPGWEPANLSLTVFEAEVYPVLIRDCSFHTCHGSQSRFFRVWGPGRPRLPPTANAFDPLVDEEVDASFRRAVAMVDARNPEESLLLKKPLAVAAGGAGHLGADRFGRNVYRSVDDSGYLALSRWVFSVAGP